MPQSIAVSTPSDHELVIVRRFEAPRALVFRCYVEPALVRRWLLGPPGWRMPHCEIDPRAGGRFRYIWRNEQDEEFGVYGTLEEIVPDRRLVSLQSYAGVAGTPVRLSVDFSGDGTITTVTYSFGYAGRAARDTAIASKMAEGMELGFRELDGFLLDTPPN